MMGDDGSSSHHLSTAEIPSRSLHVVTRLFEKDKTVEGKKIPEMPITATLFSTITPQQSGKTRSQFGGDTHYEHFFKGLHSVRRILFHAFLSLARVHAE